MAKKNYLESGLSEWETNRICSFSDFLFDIYTKVAHNCEEKGIEPFDNQLYCELADCVGTLEHLVQDEC